MPVEKWCLVFSNGIFFMMDTNPLEQKKDINAIKDIHLSPASWLNFEGDIQPGKPMNPNKKIPLHVKNLEKGKAELIENTDSFISFRLFGKKLQGFWTAKASDGSWLIGTSQPAAAPKKNNELTEW